MEIVVGILVVQLLEGIVTLIMLQLVKVVVAILAVIIQMHPAVLIRQVLLMALMVAEMVVW